MKYICYTFCTLVLCFFIVNTTFSQSKINFIECNVTYTQALGFFNRNIKNDKIGFEVSYLRQLKQQKPIFWGISLYYNQIDRSSALIQEILDFQFVDFDYVTTSNLLGLNGKFRFYPNVNLGKIEWYLEAQLGYKWLFTYTTKTLSDSTDSSDSNSESSNLSLTYGISSGINYPVSKDLYLNLRANYLPGLSARYGVINPEKEIVESTFDIFDIKKSTTDVLRWDAGITYRF